MSECTVAWYRDAILQVKGAITHAMQDCMASTLLHGRMHDSITVSHKTGGVHECLHSQNVARLLHTGK